jgi:hypothetical protein
MSGFARARGGIKACERRVRQLIAGGDGSAFQCPSGHSAVRHATFFGTLQPQAAQRSSNGIYCPQAFERQMAWRRSISAAGISGSPRRTAALSRVEARRKVRTILKKPGGRGCIEIN